MQRQEGMTQPGSYMAGAYGFLGKERGRETYGIAVRGKAGKGEKILGV